MLRNIQSLFFGSSRPQHDEPEDAEDEEEDLPPIETPQVKAGSLTTRPGFTPPQQQTFARENGFGKVDRREKEEENVVERTGIITALDHGSGIGVIDRLYKFKIDDFADQNDLRRGSRVKFRAEKTPTNPQGTITRLEMEVTEVEQKNKERMQHITIHGIVDAVQFDYIYVEVKKERNKPPIIVPVPTSLPEIKAQKSNLKLRWMKGDWMTLELKNLLPDDNNDLPADITSCRVLSARPLHVKTVVGKISKLRNNLVINDDIYVTQSLCNFQIRPETIVKCTVLQSKQYLGGENQFSNWRAINVEKSQFLPYNEMDSFGNLHEEDASNTNTSIDELGRMTEEAYKVLLNDKFGLKTIPKTLNFPPQDINSTATKIFKLFNSSERIFKLQGIHFNQIDKSVCQFTITPKRRSDSSDTEEIVLSSGDELEFEVTCCPKMIGRTSEICILDFGDFTIGTRLISVGRSDDELLLVDKSTNAKPQFRKQAGDQDISRITADLNRRRIRGCQTVRAPFFAQKRLPLNKIPNELFKILKNQDEVELKRLYPSALQFPPKFENYKEKFQVSLWFEEIENDLRRRQFDLHGVRLTRHNGQPTYFTFAAPGIQDFQPPINMQDTVDVFDEESSTNAKYQGTITNMYDNEVTCIFGETFNKQYTGIPMTVQFNLSRTNYKRCHYAVMTAVEYLGKDFLFPPSQKEIIVKPSRIIIYEEDSQVQKADEEAEAANKENKEMQEKAAQSVFRKAKPATVFNEKHRSHDSASATEIVGRRVQSVRSRFVSNTASQPSCSSAKLVWFNKNLNEEQKNAVRRILQGRARPLPYIIFGPPGTGKTVTLVEAVMQVNKLDMNSRILVCAPSNAAADVIAQYLANSDEYNPGDFVRLNGYLRSSQSMLQSIEPFCVDGEDLSKVAMNRLIIATCMTAGQFFSLDLCVGHFTHVFVDEAGYCTEPETMVPAILLALSKGGQLILAGDPNQLGPVLMSDVSQNCGLNKSFLERLMTRELYTRNEELYPVEKYNPLVLTKLVKNYRAHEMLLKVPSMLFYHNDLQSKASYEEAYQLCNDPAMKNVIKAEGVPLIFHGVQGQCTREKDSPSWLNKAEAIQVVHYVTVLLGKCGLKHDDIGIITPYRKQVEKIRLALQMTLGTDDLPKVASVEEFQGGERKVIIISTVRSEREEKLKGNTAFLDRLSFLYQPKRFNVVITRAKALMIVVGNPHVLEKNQYWAHLLKYALDLNAYKGCNLPVHLDTFLRAKAEVETTEAKSFENGTNTAIDENNGIDEHDF